jgi:F-type H+-transporting ATPase subunit a
MIQRERRRKPSAPGRCAAVFVVAALLLVSLQVSLQVSSGAAAQLHQEYETHAAAAAAYHDSAAAAHQDEYHLENIVKLLIGNIWGKDTAYRVADWVDPIFSLIVASIIALFFISVGRQLRDRDPTRKQMFAEMIVGGLYGIFRDILGDNARKYAPYLGTLFLFIFCNNLFGLIPLSHSSTASFVNTTLGLGLCTFLYVQYVGIRENGLGGYLYHFAGQPKSPIEWVFALLIFPLEVMGELIKPLSLSLRLFGNIFGEKTLIAVMVVLGTQLMQHIMVSIGAGPLGDWLPGIPFHFPFYAIGLIGSTVQATVFTLLSAIYISLMLPHGHDHAEEAH